MDQVPLWVSLAQIGASIFLGAAALCVALTSVWLTYRASRPEISGLPSEPHRLHVIR